MKTKRVHNEVVLYVHAWAGEVTAAFNLSVVTSAAEMQTVCGGVAEKYLLPALAMTQVSGEGLDACAGRYVALRLATELQMQAVIEAGTRRCFVPAAYEKLGSCTPVLRRCDFAAMAAHMWQGLEGHQLCGWGPVPFQHLLIRHSEFCHDWTGNPPGQQWQPRPPIR